ncbi:type I phosphodiesterase/nucleotide pyrophosphatase [Bifidobacterium bombi DSM 19703]|uniref:Type I phosphodiesterase/nucleotide pyrophosphatase n=2 Tax=Bifidobacterium bombi TaxID=471511 RepID=A0A080N1W4_9BIFI|nr:type I phosphodiesterase/nucleotide pyrophosphatase [Bifidobacterium bombi DSM 19703]
MTQLLDHAPLAAFGDEDTGSAADCGHAGLAGAELENDQWRNREFGQSGSDGRQRGGALHLSALLPALSAAIGFPVKTSVHDDSEGCRKALGLPQASSAVVVLIDGLGYWNLNMRIGHAPYLRSLMNRSENQRPISTCVPSTTTAAMGTFGTGTCPGVTCMTGYTQRNPQTGQLAQLISFKGAGEPFDLQREPTVFERLKERGVRVTSVGLREFSDSSLTKAALRGPDYISAGTARARLMKAAKAAREPGLTYFYLRDIDKTGHREGWGEEAWVASLENVDAQLGLLSRSVPSGTLIVITADHGMVAADPRRRMDIAGCGELTRGVAQVGGEPRAPMLYVNPGVDPHDVAGRWRKVLEGRAVVRTKDEAVAAGMYGPVSERAMSVLGDVIVHAMGESTIVDSRIQGEGEMSLPGVHGSLSHMESDIPCLVDVVD